MRAAAKAAQVDVPVEGLGGDAQLVHALDQQVVAGLALAAAHQLAGARHEQVDRRDGLAVVVLVHVERLDVLRPVIDEHRGLEVHVAQVLLVLLEDVLAVLRLVLEGDRRVAQDGDGLLVGHAGDGGLGERLQLLDEVALGVALQEDKLRHRLVEHLLHDGLEEVLLQVHQLLKVTEADLRLDHPELRRMGLRVGILSAEGRAKGVDALVRHGVGFALQLTGDRQGRRMAEEVLLRLVGLAHLGGGDGEGVARALRVVAGDQRGMHIDIAAGLEVVVDGLRGDGAHAEHRLEQAGARTQVRDLAQELEAVALGLQRIILGAVALEHHLLRLHLQLALGAHHEIADRADGRAVADGLHIGKALHLLVIDDLHR